MIIRRFNVLSALALLALLIVLNGCGGGGGGRTAPPVNDQLFQPNYVAALYDPNVNRDPGGLYFWDHLPVRVAFDPASPWPNPYPADPNFKAEAAAEWDQPGVPMIQVVSYGTPADVVVRFIYQSDFPESSIRGMTDYTHDSAGYMISATVRVALDYGASLVSANYAKETVAHELGHAIGIGGHSPNTGDLMYYSHAYNSNVFPTLTDINTMKTAYASYFGRALLMRAPRDPNAPVITETIE